MRAAKTSGTKISLPTVKNGLVIPTDEKAVSLSTVKNSVYMIGPEDALDITVWKEPDVRRVVPVRPDGGFRFQ
jgi:protein involved in polysaccharide export with SLBB domain